MSASDLLRAARAEFDLPSHTTPRLVPAARGALGQIWRLELDGQVFALKELFEPADEAVVRREVAHTTAMAACGVRLARAHSDRAGRFISPTPAGWMRLSDWVDGTKPDLADPAVPRRLGELLGVLHANAPTLATEFNGDALDQWYYCPPAIDAWPSMIARTAPEWAGRLHEAMADIASLSEIASPPTRRMVLCHRDLHPDNVLVTEDGGFAVLDWDNLGPAEPERELAHVLLDWYADRQAVKATEIAVTVAAYRDEGGTARLATLSDFSMAISARLNFLHLQLGIAADPEAYTSDREFAAREIEEALSILPSLDMLRAVLTAAA